HAAAVLDDAGAGGPVEGAHHAGDHRLAGYAVTAAVQHLVGPQRAQPRQVLDAAGPQRASLDRRLMGATRATTSDSPGSRWRSRSSKAVSTACACSRVTAPGNSATTYATSSCDRSLSSTSRQART